MKTSPSHWLDYLLWPLIKVMWEPFSRKNSHFWHWVKYEKEVGVFISIDPHLNSGFRHSGQVHNLLQTNFFWDQAVVIKPKNYTGQYRLGFEAQEGKELKREICALILEGESAILKSPYGYKLFGESFPSNDIIDLEIVNELNKKDLKPNIPLI